MKNYRSAEFAFLIGIVVVLGFFLILGAWYYAYNWSVFAFPLVLGLLAIALAGMRMVKMLGAPAAEDEADTDGTEAPAQSPVQSPVQSPIAAPALFEGAAWAQLGWLIAMLIVSYLLGFLAGPALVVAAYLKVHRFGWLAIVLMIAGTLAITYLGFTVVLQVPLPLEPFWSR
ncbi:MAG: hypothetical protein RLO50_04065 [Azospirillaceae bacterium]